LSPAGTPPPTPPLVQGTHPNNVPIGTIPQDIVDIMEELVSQIEQGSATSTSVPQDIVDIVEELVSQTEQGSAAVGGIQPLLPEAEAEAEDEEEEDEDLAIQKIIKETKITQEQANEALTRILVKQIPSSIPTRRIGAIQTLLDRNMNLKKSAKMPFDMIQRYRAWVQILYLGGLVYYGPEIQEKVIKNQIQMTLVVEKIERLQDRELKQNKDLFQNPNLAWVKQFLIDNTNKYKTFRDNLFGPSTPAASQTPPQTPAQATPGVASGAASGADTKVATPVQASNNKATAQEKRILQKTADGEFPVTPLTKELIKKFGLPLPSPGEATKGAKILLQNYADGIQQPKIIGTQLIQRFGLPPPTPPKTRAKSGRGLKHTGLKTVKQIISRTENLIQAANLGNKSTEVRNELDTLLSVLIDRKEVRPQFRTNLMKKLF
jgi:hypothetical protein